MRRYQHARVAGRLLILTLSLLVIPGCGPVWEDDADVKGARIACAGLRKAEHNECVEREAVARINPDVCHLAGIAVDDACLQAVYRAAGDPAICDRIYLRGALANCQAWYAGHTAEPRQLGTRQQPVGEHLSDCAPDTARSLPPFEQALAEEEQSFATLCQHIGRPDWQTGSGLIIYIYELEDGSEVWLGFANLNQLAYAILRTAGEQQVDLLAE
jgi:hypothetical protein